MAAEPISFHGLPSVRLGLPDGDCVVASLHGGQVLSWRPAGGAERLFLSDKQVFGADAAIRGGVPVCFPQFNQRGPLPKHGFARRASWTLQESGEDYFELLLRDGIDTHAIWPERFELRLRVTLAPGALRLQLIVHNPGVRAWRFMAALHTYLAVEDVMQASLSGLGGTRCWDAIADRRFVEDSAHIPFAQLPATGFDRVYTVASDACEAVPLRLSEASRGQRLQITQSGNFHEAVVWNPGEQGAARLADMSPSGWRHMLCVEAARVDLPVTLEPGASWEGWQAFELEKA